MTASGSPMNYGAYYPPGSSYGAPSAYNRGYPAANSYTPTGGANYGQQASSGAKNGKSGGGFAAQSGASNNGRDSTLLTGMQNMSFVNK